MLFSFTIYMHGVYLAWVKLREGKIKLIREISKRKILIASLLVLTVFLTACGGGTEEAGAGKDGGKKIEVKPKSVIDAFKDAGLEVGKDTREMKREDYGLVPMGDEGMRLMIPSLGEDAGGRVIYYKDKEYLNKAKDYYESLGKESAMLYSHVFVRDNVIVQISGDLEDEKAEEYEKVLKDM